MMVRFVVGTHRIRLVKDAMTRHIIDAFDLAGIRMASSTFELTDLPPLEPLRGRRSANGAAEAGA